MSQEFPSQLVPVRTHAKSIPFDTGTHMGGQEIKFRARLAFEIVKNVENWLI